MRDLNASLQPLLCLDLAKHLTPHAAAIFLRAQAGERDRSPIASPRDAGAASSAKGRAKRHPSVKLRSTEILSVAGLAHGSLAQHKPLARPLRGFNHGGSRFRSDQGLAARSAVGWVTPRQEEGPCPTGSGAATAAWLMWDRVAQRYLGVTLEIERKFLVANPGWKNSVIRSVRIRDGLIANNKGNKARVRIADDVATIALKSRRRGVVRTEFEYAIPYSDAEEMLGTMCDENVLHKVRHFVSCAGAIWQVDVYEGLLDGVA